MAESLDLKIRVTGNEQLDALIKKLNEGTGTLNDLTQAKKLLNKEFKETELGTEKYDQLARSLAVINDKHRDFRLQTKAGHEAYFKAGLELRQLMLATSGASGALGQFNTIVGTSVLNAVQLKQMLIPLGIQMSAIGIAISAIVSVGIGLISFLDDTSKKAREAAVELRKVKDQIIDFKLKGMLPTMPAEATKAEKEKIEAQEILALRQRIREEEARRGEISDRILQTMQGQKFAELDPDEKKLVADYELQIYQSKDKSRQAEERIAAIERERAARRKEGFLAEKFGPGEEERRRRALGEPGREAKQAAEDLKARIRGTDFRGKAIKAARGEGLDEVKDDASEIGRVLRTGFQSATAMLIQGMIQGKDIASQIGDLLLNVGLNLLTGRLSGGMKGFFSFQHGGIIPEPVIGRGLKSRSLYTFAERGPEQVIPSGRIGGFGPMSFKPGQIIAKTRLKGGDIEISLQYGERLNRRRYL